MPEEKQGLSDEFKEALAVEAEEVLGDLKSAKHGVAGEAKVNAFIAAVRTEIHALIDAEVAKAPQAKSKGELALEAEAKAKKDASKK